MDSIKANDSIVHFNETCYNNINEHIKSNNFSKIFILVDENTHEHCLPKFLNRLETDKIIEIIEIESGEINKNIDTCVGVWNTLSELDADRKSLMINIGGGVITDLGGFVACTFKRGISYVNVPTTLLSMVDASVGGKTGVDLGHLKNQIGVISNPDLVLIDTSFLDTLPKEQMRSGLAEMLKHGLITGENYWNKFQDLSKLNLDNLDELIHESVIIKRNVVEEDPFENGLRKTLNFGHTLGHAIESYFLSNENKTTLLHGEAIIVGMILASYISTELLGFQKQTTQNIKDLFLSYYDKVTFEDNDYDAIIELLKYDKKNNHGNINFVLLESIGTCKIDCLVDNNVILDAFQFYAS
ncbi:3-dehydroquinate synthase [Algibacter amylolyticus]|uniref:3-dehydroquinate synthase n=1 Tax=Algibacter amylolyticus TaxID=1608400 RepID=A0A5M7B866_9FLAO|nr:3-dehydroquinate synthase [Algibacter amylolyticus]KAA5825579.1 3-dehydroquinate synthase [Algibacter amylolyticus]MBB5268196.1 3-dehydroquinate synthase [Algibacter amylolyticus]TSJ79877.1 3-dehydroquinate synthase [Algibacter amylolyticus]